MLRKLRGRDGKKSTSDPEVVVHVCDSEKHICVYFSSRMSYSVSGRGGSAFREEVRESTINILADELYVN